MSVLVIRKQVDNKNPNEFKVTYKVVLTEKAQTWKDVQRAIFYDDPNDPSTFNLTDNVVEVLTVPYDHISFIDLNIHKAEYEEEIKKRMNPVVTFDNLKAFHLIKFGLGNIKGSYTFGPYFNSDGQKFISSFEYDKQDLDDLLKQVSGLKKVASDLGYCFLDKEATKKDELNSCLLEKNS